MNYVKLGLILLGTLVLSNCAGAPKVTICQIINKDVASCRPPKRSDKPYDKPTKRMRGYQCISPEDMGAVKKFIYNSTEDLYESRLQ